MVRYNTYKFRLAADVHSLAKAKVGTSRPELRLTGKHAKGMAGVKLKPVRQHGSSTSSHREHARVALRKLVDAGKISYGMALNTLAFIHNFQVEHRHTPTSQQLGDAFPYLRPYLHDYSSPPRMGGRIIRMSAHRQRGPPKTRRRPRSPATN